MIVEHFSNSQTFDDLLSPAGIVNQFVLSIFFQIVSIVGYAIAGKVPIFKIIYLKSIKCTLFLYRYTNCSSYICLESIHWALIQ